MKLTDLEPRFLLRLDDVHEQEIDSLQDAYGICFVCPICFEKNGGPIGTHSIICYFKDRGVPDDKLPGPGRWTPSGSGYADLTLTPSVHLTGEGCGWHGHITNGEITP